MSTEFPHYDTEVWAWGVPLRVENLPAGEFRIEEPSGTQA